MPPRALAGGREAQVWDLTREEVVPGPELAPPEHRPRDQPAPGPRDRVPPDWLSHLH